MSTGSEATPRLSVGDPLVHLGAPPPVPALTSLDITARPPPPHALAVLPYTGSTTNLDGGDLLVVGLSALLIFLAAFVAIFMTRPARLEAHGRAQKRVVRGRVQRP